jgi:hypothetical protein
MNGNQFGSRSSYAVLGISLAIGLVLRGWALGVEIRAAKLDNRSATVKGLVERDVKSDAAVWPLGYKEAENDLAGVYSKMEADKSAVLQLLAAQGIRPSEIEVREVYAVDKQADEYRDSQRPVNRSIVEQQITVTTSQVDQVAAAA